MKRLINICMLSFVALLAAAGCSRADLSDLDISTDGNTSDQIVEVLADGRIRVSASIAATEQTPIETRAMSSISPDNIIYTGWCMVFGVDKTQFDVSEVDGVQIVTYKYDVYDDDGNLIHAAGSETDAGYGKNSPLLQKTRIIANTNGRFYMTFDETTDRVILRIVANLTAREEESYEGAVTQAEIDSGDSSATKPATFGQFLKQSVGLDGIYNFNYGGVAHVDYNEETGEGTGDVTYNPKNTASPDPSSTQRAFPMTSFGYVIKDGISIESIKQMFDEEIKMIRIFSKIVVHAKEGSGFEIESVTLLKGANESRIRSTVLSATGEEVGKIDNVPVNLGGAVKYQSIGVLNESESLPIYLYPNSVGDYDFNGGAVDKDINPTYIIIKGKASEYSEPGYYKVALKARYPLTFDEDGNPLTYSAVTYDILRDNFFHINLEKVDKPGYPTFEDAEDENNPANNISYSIVINGEDNRNEYLVSKGTYFVELKTSRVYARGFAGQAVTGNIEMSLNPSTDNYHPNVYIYGEGVTITSVSADGNSVNATELLAETTPAIRIDASDNKQNITIGYSATATGRICIRSGDILKYIPVVYQNDTIKTTGEGPLSIKGGTYNAWTHFAYSDIYYTAAEPQTLTLNSDGSVAPNTEYETKTIDARMFPTDGSGFLQLFAKQASNFNVWDNAKGGTNGVEATNFDVEFKSTGEIHSSTPSGYTKPPIIVEDGVSKNRYKYKINGDVNDVTIVDSDTETYGDFSQFWQSGNIAVNEEFSFDIKDIGTNGGELTKDADVKITLQNSAKEKKSYTFKIKQYAAPNAAKDPNVEELVINNVTYLRPEPVDSSVGDYLNFGHKRQGKIWYKDNYRAEDKNKQLTSITIQNCIYTKSSIEEGATYGWKWEEAPASIVKDGTGDAVTQKNYVDAAIRVDQSRTGKLDSDGYGSYIFDFYMNPGSYDERNVSYKLASACFVVIVENKIGEICETRFLLQCEAVKKF